MKFEGTGGFKAGQDGNDGGLKVEDEILFPVLPVLYTFRPC
jgi:hypothetical protein